MFAHTSFEPQSRMWRGWVSNGQSMEVSWSRCSVGAGVLIHSNDSDMGSRMIWIALGFIQFFIPIGIDKRNFAVGEEPSWQFYCDASDIVLQLGKKFRSWRWPFCTEVIDWSYETNNGWAPVKGAGEYDGDHYDSRPRAKKFVSSYVYELRSGELQYRTAIANKNRWVRGRRFLDRIGWPRRTAYCIDVEFDKGIGEGTGSWKGGTVGCSYDMRKGETVLETLLRMQSERKFER